MAHLLVPNKRNLLVSGYFRQRTWIYIPFDLQRKVYKYYNDIVDWRLSGVELEKFMQTEHNTMVYGPIFYLADIPFQLVSFPNGCKVSGNTGFVNLYIQLLHNELPKDITHFHIYAHFFSTVNKVQWKKGINLRFFSGTNGRKSGWFRYNMNVSEYKECESLSFCCYAELTDIKRISRTTKIYTLTTLKSTCIYQWDVDSETLNTFAIARQGQCHYSPNFNDGCFCLIVIPQGRVTDPQGSFRTFVKLLKLPQKVMNVQLKCKLQIITGSKKNETEYTFCEKLGFTKRQPVASSTVFYEPSEAIFKDVVSIRATMDILHVFDAAGTIIQREKWNKFNVT